MNKAYARDRFRWTLRDSIDELLDGARTGRWAYQQLTKTEKTHLGTIIEINLTKEFDLAGGDELDWSVDGTDLDCKFSKDVGGWEIPMEMYVAADHGEQSGRANHPALLVWVNDDSSQWAVGLFRATDAHLRWKMKDGERVRAYNRDNKRRIDAAHLEDIYWLWGGAQTDLPENTLLHMDPARRGRVLAPGMSGQQRVDALFRENVGELVRRPVLCTVAQQDDAPKRARDARQHLQPEGILVLGHQEAHPEIALALGLPVPVKGEWVAVRVVAVTPTDPRSKAYFDGSWWRVATSSDRQAPAPNIPRHHLPPQMS